MSKPEEKRQIFDIVSIDPFYYHAFSYAKNEIRASTLEKSDKTSFFISYIRTRDIINSTIDISRNVPDSDLKDAIDIKTYDELALDSSIEYAISYIETESKEAKNRTFNVFVIDLGLLKSRLSPISEKTSYIDYVTSAPFLVKSLYTKNLIEKNDIHGFVYLQKNDAFLAIYKNGEYLYSKSLHYSLKEMNEKFCELLGERIEEEGFYKILMQKESNTQDNPYNAPLNQLMGEIFSYINDVLVFVKRSYGIESFDKIYIGSEIGVFSGLEDQAKERLSLDIFPFNFSIAINSKDWYIDQLHILMMLSAQVYIENPDETLNFSIFKRPPPLRQRASGKLLSVLGLSIVIALAFPLYQLAYDTYLSIVLQQKTKEYNAIFKRTSDIRAQLASLKIEKEKIDVLVGAETKKFEFRKKLLDEIYNKKISYPMKAQMLLEIFELSNQSQSKVELVTFNNNRLDISVRNVSEKKITEFIQALTLLKKYKITTDKIIKDDELKLYTSTISIGLFNDKL